jgi:hypothetical protein
MAKKLRRDPKIVRNSTRNGHKRENNKFLVSPLKPSTESDMAKKLRRDPKIVRNSTRNGHKRENNKFLVSPLQPCTESHVS